MLDNSYQCYQVGTQGNHFGRRQLTTVNHRCLREAGLHVSDNIACILCRCLKNTAKCTIPTGAFCFGVKSVSRVTVAPEVALDVDTGSVLLADVLEAFVDVLVTRRSFPSIRARQTAQGSITHCTGIQTVTQTGTFTSPGTGRAVWR